jgi:hypothetical protein
MPRFQQPEPSSDAVIPTRFVVKPFTGTNESLQSFIEDTWSDAYSGRMSFPVWSKEYLDWQLANHDGEPDRRLAVYDDDRLVAVLLGTPAKFKTQASVFKGAHWSWLSIAASHRGHGLATLLDQARVNLEHLANSKLVVSYRFTGSKYSLAEKPSSRFPLKRFHSRVGFWARPLDGKRLREWNLDRTEGFLSRIVTPLLPAVRWPLAENVREFAIEELSDCLKVVKRHFENSVLTIDWDDHSLRHQLAGSPVTQTVVAIDDGQVQGFVNFHILPFQGATREPVGIIDMMCVRLLSAKMQATLLKSTLGLMREQGAVLALKIRCGDVPGPLMLRTGFMPRLADSSLVLQWIQSVQEIPGGKPLHLLWR